MNIEDRIAAVEKDLLEIKEVLYSVKEILVKADKVIDGVAKEVKPTLDALTAHPMLKMFLGGKR